MSLLKRHILSFAVRNENMNFIVFIFFLIQFLACSNGNTLFLSAARSIRSSRTPLMNSEHTTAHYHGMFCITD